jgi:hypothetical protein
MGRHGKFNDNSRRMVDDSPRIRFQEVAEENRWRYDSQGFHKAHVNSNKLPVSMKYQPSYLVDTNFNDDGTPLWWVEIKSISREGKVKIQRDEWDVHKKFRTGSPVMYALYDVRANDFPFIIDITAIEHLLADDGDYFILNTLDIKEEEEDDGQSE